MVPKPISLRTFLGRQLADKYLGPEPVAIEDWGHEDCEVCEAARYEVVDDGRWTYTKEGETPSQATCRLEAGGPDVERFTYRRWQRPHFEPAPHNDNNGEGAK